MRRLLAPLAAIGLTLAVAGTVLAWVQPILTSDCAPDANSYAWKINLHSEDNYSIDWSFDSGFAGATTVDFGSSGDHSFTTPRGGATLYVRWSSDHSSKAQADANGDLCEKESQAESVAESVAQSVEQSVEAGTGTPAGSLPNSSLSGTGSNPLTTVVFSLVLVGSLSALAYGNVRVTKKGARSIR